MKTMKKTVVAVLCGAALVVSSVMCTVAYLTAQDHVTNTFTVGRVAITLDEAAVAPDGTYVTDESNRVQTNEYHLLPGHSYTKDPVIHVDAASENCWLFVQIANDIAAIESPAAQSIDAQMSRLGWSKVDGAEQVYAYQQIANAGQDIPVFESFSIAAAVDQDTLAGYQGKQILVNAYAIQSEGFTTASEAWAAGGFGA